MAKYTALNPSKAQSITVDMLALDTTSTALAGHIDEVSWGGEMTTSTAMHTQVKRASTQGTTLTATAPVASQKINPRSPANGLLFGDTWVTQPTLAAGALFATSWNSHGGVVRWLAAPGEEFVLIGAGGISIRGSVGTGTASWAFIWTEW